MSYLLTNLENFGEIDELTRTECVYVCVFNMVES